ncbi:hypothetical protein L3X38_043540 [Prunus dulcis]|uniref:Late embryogenesis abundant protein LEA-2 subgroup domain-containing protein n=1 Tax=Prunus dulcis TaxID=3755 RepID=A0AAD4YMK6_PRUDU|nr:hypothetical protein L3X38_043540 [Prunus dulcis]
MDAHAQGNSPPRRINWRGIITKWLKIIAKWWGAIAILSVGAILIVVLAALVLFKQVVIKPLDPEFRLQSATVSLFNTSAAEFTATWDVKFIAVNPNHKLNISYNSMRAAMFYKTNNSDGNGVLLATKPVPPPSSLSPKAETTRSFRVETASAYVGEDVAKEISEGIARGSVSFVLRLLGSFKFSSYWTDPRKFEASCHRVEFGFSPGNSTGALTLGQSRVCGTDLGSGKFCLFD